MSRSPLGAAERELAKVDFGLYSTSSASIIVTTEIAMKASETEGAQWPFGAGV